MGPGTGSRVVCFFLKKMPRRVCFPWECVGFPVHGQGHEYGHNRAFHPCLCFCCILYSSLQWVVWFLMVSMIAVTRTCWGTSCRHLAAASLALPARVVSLVWVLLVSFLLLGSTAGLHTTDMKITALCGYFFWICGKYESKKHESAAVKIYHCSANIYSTSTKECRVFITDNNWT